MSSINSFFREVADAIANLAPNGSRIKKIPSNWQLFILVDSVEVVEVRNAHNQWKVYSLHQDHDGLAEKIGETLKSIVKNPNKEIMVIKS